MTPQEETMLGDLVRRVQQTQLTEKDPDAQQLLDEQIGGNPDALYVLAQTVLVQKYALEQAQKQLEQLKQQAQQPAKASSFLGGLFGHAQTPPPAQQPASQQQYYAAPPPAYAPVNQQPLGNAYPPQGFGGAPAFGSAPGYGAPQGYPPMPGGGSSFLRSAATTAAGVAAGALAFEGVESLMHGFGHSAGFGGGGFGGEGFGGRPEETVINNYYDEPRGAEGEHGQYGGERGGGFDAAERGQHDSGYGQSGDNDLQPQLDQADDVNVGNNDGGSFDDASLDTSDNDFGGNDSDDSNFV